VFRQKDQKHIRIAEACKYLLRFIRPRARQHYMQGALHAIAQPSVCLFVRHKGGSVKKG